MGRHLYGCAPVSLRPPAGLPGHGADPGCTGGGSPLRGAAVLRPDRCAAGGAGGRVGEAIRGRPGWSARGSVVGGRTVPAPAGAFLHGGSAGCGLHGGGALGGGAAAVGRGGRADRAGRRVQGDGRVGARAGARRRLAVRRSSRFTFYAARFTLCVSRVAGGTGRCGGFRVSFPLGAAAAGRLLGRALDPAGGGGGAVGFPLHAAVHRDAALSLSAGAAGALGLGAGGGGGRAGRTGGSVGTLAAVAIGGPRRSDLDGALFRRYGGTLRQVSALPVADLSAVGGVGGPSDPRSRTMDHK